MDISYSLAARILRDVRSPTVAQFRLNSLPERLPYTVPTPANVETPASVQRSCRSYDLLQKVPLAIASVQAFYLNRLRFAGWYFSQLSEDTIGQSFGTIYGHQLRPSRLTFFSPQQSLILFFQPLRCTSTETTYLLSVEDANDYPATTLPATAASINWTPMPVLLPLPNSRRRGGSLGGDNRYHREFHILETNQTTTEVLDWYRTQIDEIGWQLVSTHADSDVTYGFWKICDHTNQPWTLFLSISNSGTPGCHAVILTVDSKSIDQYSASTRNDVPDVPVDIVEMLLVAREKSTKLTIGPSPQAAPSFLPLPLDAQLMASVEYEQNRQRFLLEMPGSVTTIQEEVANHLQSADWLLSTSNLEPRTIGFLGNAACAASGTVFHHSDYPNHRLTMFAEPENKDAACIELMLDHSPDRVFYSPGRTNDSATNSADAQKCPVLRFAPLQDTTVYSSELVYGDRSWRSSSVVLNASSDKALLAHYTAQLSASEWQVIAATPAIPEKPVIASSWRWRSEENVIWLGLLWLTPLLGSDCGYVVSFQAFTGDLS